MIEAEPVSATEAQREKEVQAAYKTMPCGRNVLFLLDEPPDKTAGGIHLTDNSQEKVIKGKGTILRVGPTVDPAHFGLTAQSELIGRRCRLPLYSAETRIEGRLALVNFEDIASIDPIEDKE